MPANKAGRGGRQALGLADLKRLSKEASKAAQAARKKAAAAASALSGTHHDPGSVGAAGKTAVPILSADDVRLFRHTMKTVTPIKDTRRVVLPPPAAGAELLRQRRAHAAGHEPVRPPLASDHYSPAKVDEDDTRYLRPGHGPDVIKSLKRGKWPIVASVDLHGDTLEEARERLERFLQTCADHQIKCVRVVHGKGYGSKGGEPVLKQTVRRWLTQLAAVIAYVECKEHDGGAGAVQVLLQTSPGERHGS